MKIEVRLFATLRQYLPPGSGRSAAEVALADDACIADVIAKLAIPPAQVALVLVNGRYEADHARRLDEGEVLSLFPHIAGG